MAEGGHTDEFVQDQADEGGEQQTQDRAEEEAEQQANQQSELHATHQGEDPAPEGRWPARVGRFPRPLLVVLATFHLLALTLAALVPAYVSGGLSDALPSLGTLPGLVLFALLWGLTLVATGWALSTDPLGPDLVVDRSRILLRGSVAGALVGMSTVGALILVALGQSLLEGGGVQAGSAILVGVIALAVGAVVGLVVGIGLAVLDLLVVAVVRRVVPMPDPA
jgi:hypothetical protein